MRPRDQRPYAQATRQMPVLPTSGQGGAPRPPGGAAASNWTPGGCSPAIFLVAFLVLLLLAGAGLANQRRGQPVSSPTSPAASGAAATPTPSAPGAVYFIVGNTGGDGVYLRRTPRLADRDRAYPDGTKLEQIGPDQDADGRRWHHVRAPDGRTGWVPSQYALPAP